MICSSWLCVEACQEEDVGTPIFVTSEIHHGLVQSYQSALGPWNLLQELEYLRLFVSKERLVGMIRIGGTLQTPYKFHQLGSRMVAKGCLVLGAQGSHIRAQASGIFAIGLATWVCEQMVEAEGAAERWPLALFVGATPRELSEGEHGGAI